MKNVIPKIGIVSLGCPKALVDSERILSKLRADGYEISGKYSSANLVIVNTCGFLNTAKQESLDEIHKAMEQNGNVIVTGCFGVEEERIRDAYPGVLAVTGPHQYEQVVDAVHKALPPPISKFDHLVHPEIISLTPRHYAYLKISEGCNNRCSFCIIPKLRGELTSRAANEVMYEAERLKNAGVKELLVISQDTSAYGADIKYAGSDWRGRLVKARLTDLASAMGELGIWIRLHYVYPYPNVDEIIPLIAEGKILPYLDIPFQHASPKILKKMRRPANRDRTLERIRNWRREVPDLALRSSFIVGFPGESEEDFEDLLGWLEEAQLSRVGCFKYEQVEGAEANNFEGMVPEELKEERWHRLMEWQRRISEIILTQKIGQTIEVIVDEVNEKGAICRSRWDAPEIDGKVFLKDDTKLVPGTIVDAKVKYADEYDLWAKRIPRAKINI